MHQSLTWARSWAAAGLAVACCAAAVNGSGLGASPSSVAVVRAAPFQISEDISGGQSTSVGNSASITNAGNIYGNLAFVCDGGAYQSPTDPTCHFVTNATDPIRPLTAGTPYTYPTNIQGETGDSRFQDQVTVLATAAGWPGGFLSVEDTTGVTGTNLAGLDVGTVPFDAGVYSAATVHYLATAQGKTEGVWAIPWTHGEHDAIGQNFSYGTQLVAFRTNWANAMAAQTGQDQAAHPIRLFLTGEGSCPSPQLGENIDDEFWKAAIADPRIVYVGPRYQYDAYYQGGIHLNATGYWVLKEKLAQAAFSTESTGTVWQPLWPTAFSRASNVVTITFHLPPGNSGLVFDPSNGRSQHTTAPNSAFWANGWGFEPLDQRLAGFPTGYANNGSGLVRITWPSHGRTTGDVVNLDGFYNNAGAPMASVNATWTVTAIDANNFDLQGSAFVAATALYNLAKGYLPISVTSVSASGAQVTLTMGRSPVGSTLEVWYAHFTDLAPGGGGVFTGGWQAGKGRAGALRGDATFTGISGVAQYDWAIGFGLTATSPVTSN